MCFRLCWRGASCSNISRHRKQTHVEAVLADVAVPTCAASDAGVDGPHLHAHQQAWSAQLHAYMHQHVKQHVMQAQQLHAGTSRTRMSCMRHARTGVQT